jgi:hypothetical protein
LLVFISPGIVIAEPVNRVLLHNPFNKPSILAAPKKITKAQQPAEDERELDITAILISDAMPLVIASGELLTLGDSVSGFRLISVDEGRATFSKQGNTYTFSLADSGVEIEQ